MIQCKVEIKGTFRGRAFVYRDEGSDASQFFHHDENGNLDAGDYWWRDGNMSCDCNRACFLPEEMRNELERSSANEEAYACGEEIRIDSIVPIERGPGGEELPALYLNES